MKMELKADNKLLAAFDAETLRSQGHKLVDQLADYLEQVRKPSELPVIDWDSPEAKLDKWQVQDATGVDINELFAQVLEQATHLQHPRYMGHQVTPALPAAALADFLMSFLNNGSTIYEMAPVGTAIEHNLICWMAEQITFDPSLAGGVFTAGGSLGNLTALLAARQAKAGFDTWSKGSVTEPEHNAKFSLLVSSQAHYSISRAVKIMGWGEEGAIPVSVDANYRLDPAALEAAYRQALRNGRKVIAVVANSCCTATGSFDPIDKIADFCEEHNLWLHVDGAHGASLLLSDKYKHLLKGIERADSVVWDAHKMMLMPALVTGVIFKDKKHSHQSFQQQASYLMTKDSYQEWFNICHRTVECTKNTMALKLYISLAVYGKELFVQHIEKNHALAKYFAQCLKAALDFELPHEPETNIVCFRYLPENIKVEELDDLQARIRQVIIESGDFYFVQTRLPQGLFLRITILSPFTTESDLDELLNQVRRVAR